jgi:hypothetical protein
VSRADNSIVVHQDSLSVTTSGVSDNTVLPLSSDGSLVLNNTSGVRVGVSGFSSGSTVTVWLFSTPTLLGHALIDASGGFSATFPMPPGIASGHHHIVLKGTGANGKAATFSIAAVVPSKSAVTRSRAFSFAIMLPLIAAILSAAFLPSARKRRRKSA